MLQAAWRVIETYLSACDTCTKVQYIPVYVDSIITVVVVFSTVRLRYLRKLLLIYKCDIADVLFKEERDGNTDAIIVA